MYTLSRLEKQLFATLVRADIVLISHKDPSAEVTELDPSTINLPPSFIKVSADCC